MTEQLNEIIKEMEEDLDFIINSNDTHDIGFRSALKEYLPKLKSLSGEEVKGKDEETILKNFMSFCKNVDETWAKEFEMWIPDYLSQSLSQNEPTEEGKEVCCHCGKKYKKKNGVACCPECESRIGDPFN